MAFLDKINVNVDSTSDVDILNNWFKLLTKDKKYIACDFEVASRWSDFEKEEMIKQLDLTKLDSREYLRLYRRINSNGLSHPSMTTITHFSFAFNPYQGYVAICNNDIIRSAVLEFLIETELTQIWHNFCYDGRILHFHTGKFPKHIIDTQLLVKCLTNNADNSQNNTKLKYLMAYAYGDWAIAKENFTLDEQHNPKVIRYSGIDACATYKLFEDIRDKQTILEL